MPVVGVVSAPALGRRWWASAGGGAHTSDASGERAISVSGVRDLSDAYLSTTHLGTWVEYHSREAYLALVDACWENRAFGDFWQHCLVAEGAIDVAAESIVNPWDVAPFQVLTKELIFSVPKPDVDGYVTYSKVNPVQEMAALITAQRAYDLNSKVITASDEMMATVTQMR